MLGVKNHHTKRSRPWARLAAMAPPLTDNIPDIGRRPKREDHRPALSYYFNHIDALYDFSKGFFDYTDKYYIGQDGT